MNLKIKVVNPIYDKAVYFYWNKHSLEETSVLCYKSKFSSSFRLGVSRIKFYIEFLDRIVDPIEV